MTTRRLRWGIMGTGVIARTFASALSRSRTGKLTAVASRTNAAAAQFAAEFEASRAHGSYEGLLADPDVDVVYIATPHPSHADWAIRAARAKKHVLCEKPLAMNHAEASAIVLAARENDVFLMEAFMYRCHPQTKQLIELIAAGRIGRVKAIEASFSIDGAFPVDGRLLSNELGGGGILDVGCYPVSMARLVAGAAIGQPFSDPLEVQGAGYVGRSKVDEYAVGILKFPGEILATVATGVQLWRDNSVRVFGSDGRLVLEHPWHPAELSEIVIEHQGSAPVSVPVTATDSSFVYEIDAVAEQIELRQAREMPLRDSLGNALTLDRWRSAVGVTFAADLAARVP